MSGADALGVSCIVAGDEETEDRECVNNSEEGQRGVSNSYGVLM